MGLWEFLKQGIWTLGAITALVNGGLPRTAAFEQKHESGKYIVVHELMTPRSREQTIPRSNRQISLCWNEASPLIDRTCLMLAISWLSMIITVTKPLKICRRENLESLKCTSNIR